eukprot:jgi/Undpi1/13494/HiC_scaffold_8.g03153.m1
MCFVRQFWFTVFRGLPPPLAELFSIDVLAELRDLKSDINELGRSLNGSSCALRPAGLNGRRKAGTPTFRSSGASSRATSSNNLRSTASAQESTGLESPSALLRCLQRDTDIDTDFTTSQDTTGRARHHHAYARSAPRRHQRKESNGDDDNDADPPSPRWPASRSFRLTVPKVSSAPATHAVSAATATAVMAVEAAEAARGSGVRADYGGVKSAEELLLRVEASVRAVSREKDEIVKALRGEREETARLREALWDDEALKRQWEALTEASHTVKQRLDSTERIRKRQKELIEELQAMEADMAFASIAADSSYPPTPPMLARPPPPPPPPPTPPPPRTSAAGRRKSHLTAPLPFPVRQTEKKVVNPAGERRGRGEATAVERGPNLNASLSRRQKLLLLRRRRGREASLDEGVAGSNRETWLKGTGRARPRPLSSDGLVRGRAGSGSGLDRDGVESGLGCGRGRAESGLELGCGRVGSGLRSGRGSGGSKPGLGSGMASRASLLECRRRRQQQDRPPTGRADRANSRGGIIGFDGVNRNEISRVDISRDNASRDDVSRGGNNRDGSVSRVGISRVGSSRGGGDSLGREERTRGNGSVAGTTAERKTWTGRSGGGGGGNGGGNGGAGHVRRRIKVASSARPAAKTARAAALITNGPTGRGRAYRVETPAAKAAAAGAVAVSRSLARPAKRGARLRTTVENGGRKAKVTPSSSSWSLVRLSSKAGFEAATAASSGKVRRLGRADG